MRDLRKNFQGGNEYYEEINERYNSNDPKVQAQAMKDARVFEVNVGSKKLQQLWRESNYRIDTKGM